MVDVLEDAESWNCQGFFVFGPDCVGLGAGLLVAHIAEGAEFDTAIGEVVVEALESCAGSLEWGVADNSLLIKALCGLLFLLQIPSSVDGLFFYGGPSSGQAQASLFDGPSCAGYKDLADAVFDGVTGY